MLAAITIHNDLGPQENKICLLTAFRSILDYGEDLGLTADGDYSHEIKRCLLFGRKAMINLDSVFKSRDITLLTKVHLVKAMVFPVAMYGCESWTIKKDECQRIDSLFFFFIYFY